jgi:hypothetical protein
VGKKAEPEGHCTVLCIALQYVPAFNGMEPESTILERQDHYVPACGKLAMWGISVMVMGKYRIDIL